MHDPDPDDLSKTGISFHWDKDEDLRILAGGSLHVHPHLSTVTYLTDLGAPTMVLNCRVNNVTGEWIVPGSDSDEHVEGFVSWPKQGKHLSFDGRFLHAAPPDLMEDNMFEEQCKILITDGDSSDVNMLNRQQKLLERRHRRVTFLVNIWLNYRPFNVNPFPDTMIDKLTKTDESRYKDLFSVSDEEESARCVTIHNNTVKDVEQESESNDVQTKGFTWPMGDCDSNEEIQVQMPLLTIQREASRSGNVRIRWETEGVRLTKNAKSTDHAPTERANGKAKNESTTTSDQSETKRTKIDHDDSRQS